MSEGGFDLDSYLAPRLRVMRIILLALVLGCLSFLGIAVSLRLTGNLGNGTAPLLTYMGIGFAALMFVMHLVVPRLSLAGIRKQIARGAWQVPQVNLPAGAPQSTGLSDAALLCGLYQSQMMIAAALLEGAAFFNLIAYLQEGDPASLAVAGLLIAALLWLFPTRTRVENFLVEQGERLRQERQAV